MATVGVLSLEVGFRRGGCGGAINSPRSLHLLKRNGLTADDLLELPLSHFVAEYRGDVELASRKLEHWNSKRDALVELLHIERRLMDDEDDTDAADTPTPTSKRQRPRQIAYRTPTDAAGEAAAFRDATQARLQRTVHEDAARRGRVQALLAAAAARRSDALARLEERDAERRARAAAEAAEAARQCRARAEAARARAEAQRERLCEGLRERKAEAAARRAAASEAASGRRGAREAEEAKRAFLRRRARARRVEECLRAREEAPELRRSGVCGSGGVADAARHALAAEAKARADEETRVRVEAAAAVVPRTREREVRTGQKAERRRGELCGKSVRAAHKLEEEQEQMLNYLAYKAVVGERRERRRGWKLASIERAQTEHAGQLREREARSVALVEALAEIRDYDTKCKRQEKELYLEDHRERARRLRLIQDYRLECLRTWTDQKLGRIDARAKIADESTRQRRQCREVAAKIRLVEPNPGPGAYLGQDMPAPLRGSSPSACISPPPLVLAPLYAERWCTHPHPHPHTEQCHPAQQSTRQWRTCCTRVTLPCVWEGKWIQVLLNSALSTSACFLPYPPPIRASFPGCLCCVARPHRTCRHTRTNTITLLVPSILHLFLAPSCC